MGIVFRTHPDAVTHATLVRCPYCRSVGEPVGQAGGRRVITMTCEACKQDYGVIVTSQYTSPPLESEADDE